jgi:predicted deacylase
MIKGERRRRLRWRMLAVFGCLTLAVGCGARESEMARYGVNEPASPVEVQPTVEYQEMRIGTSVQGRPIKMLVFGGAPGTPILIMGAIHGDETTTVDLTTNLIELLKARPEVCAGKRVAVIPVANPDGYAARTRSNANRVDVNRNFPATNYRAGRSSSTQPRFGPSAASEPETRAVLKAIDEIGPRLLISIHSITDGRQCNNYDGPAQAIAELMSAKNGYRCAANIGYPTPGSLGSYAGIDKQIPMITLELPRNLPDDKAWAQNRDALVAAIAAAK